MFTGIAIDDKLAYPLYTAACDEGAVVTINVGVPGPMKPAKLQRTILVDEVALAFPDLKIVMTHLGDPWISETVSMLVKHPNVFAMTAGLGAEVRARGDPRGPAAAQQDQAHVVLRLSDPAVRPDHHRGPSHRAARGLARQLPRRERAGRLRRPAPRDRGREQPNRSRHGTSRRTRRHRHRCRAAVSAASTHWSSRGRERASWSTTSGRSTTSWPRSRSWAVRRSGTTTTSPTGTGPAAWCRRRSTPSASCTCWSTTPASCATRCS